MPRQTALVSVCCLVTIGGAAFGQVATVDFEPFLTSPPASAVQQRDSLPQMLKAPIPVTTAARQSVTEPTKGLASQKVDQKPDKATANKAVVDVRKARGLETDARKESKLQNSLSGARDTGRSDTGSVQAAVSERADSLDSKAAVSVVEATPGASASETDTVKKVREETPHGRIDKVRLMAESEKKGGKSSKADSTTVKTGLAMILKLGVVLALAYLTILALKLLSSKREMLPRSHTGMRVVDTVKLSQSSSLHLVDINGKTLLVGASGSQVNLLREFDEDERLESESVPDGRFAEYLNRCSGDSLRKSPAGRVAGVLRDCATYLKSRNASVAVTDAPKAGVINEA